MKPFWILLSLFGLIFAILFSFRLGAFNKFNSVSQELVPFSIERVPEKDSWMNILQNRRKIEFSHTFISKTTKGYLLKETIYIIEAEPVYRLFMANIQGKLLTVIEWVRIFGSFALVFSLKIAAVMAPMNFGEKKLSKMLI